MVNCSRCGKQLTSPSACTHCGTTSGQKQQKKGRHLLLRKYGISTFPYIAKKSGELSFDTAEIFQLHQETDENWFQATSVDYNTNGLVPKSHISLIPESSEIYKKYAGDDNSSINKMMDKNPQKIIRSSLALIKYSTNNFFFSIYNSIIYQIFCFLKINDLHSCLLVSKSWHKIATKSLHSSHKSIYQERLETKGLRNKNENQRYKIWKEDPFCILMQPYPVLADHNLNLEDNYIVNVCLLGSPNTGKSCVSDFFVNNKFNEKYTSSTKNNMQQKKLAIDGENILFQITDTTLKEQEFGIMKSNFFIILYSISDKNSFQSVEKIYQQILTLHSNKAYVPTFLVANKNDLPDSNRVVSFEDGLQLAKSLKMDGFFEISAKVGSSLFDLFVNAARATSLSVVLNEQNASQKESTISIKSVKKISTKSMQRNQEHENTRCLIC